MGAGEFWSEWAAWPERFLVRLLVGDEFRIADCEVVTSLGPLKAVAMACAMHVRRAGEHVGIHDVVVESLGVVGTGLDGRPERVPGALVDHKEVLFKR